MSNFTFKLTCFTGVFGQFGVGNRPDAPDIMVVITDGVTTVDADKLRGNIIDAKSVSSYES